MLAKIFSLSLLLLLSCSKTTSTNSKGLKGSITIDGSSTVYPITEAVAEEFIKAQPRVRITVGVSGTGGGFKKFSQGETDINDASRKIKASEIKKIQEKGLSYIELPVAYDGISLVVHPSNHWATHLTTQELKKIWSPGSTVKSWKDVRSSWPDIPLKLYGPGPDSGTFDYFTEAINGKSHICRSDYTKSEDDNVLVMGVSGDKGSLGFFGFAYYKENASKLKIVPVDDGQGPVTPTLETINQGTYSPLSRQVFIYVRKDSLKRPEVRSFIEFYLSSAKDLVGQVGYVPLPEAQYEASLKKL